MPAIFRAKRLTQIFDFERIYYKGEIRWQLSLIDPVHVAACNDGTGIVRILSRQCRKVFAVYNLLSKFANSIFCLLLVANLIR